MTIERAFVDTNVFLRFLTNDVPAQADAVERLLRRAAAGTIALVTTPMVIAEIVWTLESFYRLDKPVIRDHVMAVLNTPGLDVLEADRVLQAINWYDERNIDFIDAYHAAWMRHEDLALAFTFDVRHFGRIDGLDVRRPS